MAKKKRNTGKPLRALMAIKRRNSQGRAIFQITPSRMSQRDMQRIVKAVNDSLYRLEKAGVQMDSKIYQNIMHYAVDENSKMYNVDLEKGTVRATTDFSRFSTPAEKYEYINMMRGILMTKTRTVAGTKKSIEKAYKSFLKISEMYRDIESDPASTTLPSLGFGGSGEIVEDESNQDDTTVADSSENQTGMSFEQYRNLWRIYRKSVTKDVKERMGSDVVLRLIMTSNFYMMDDTMIETAMKYFNDYQTDTAVSRIKNDIKAYTRQHIAF